MYARLNQRRPGGPSANEMVRIGQLLTYKGDISVDSYWVDEVIQRKTALYEAMYRKNLPEVEWLLKVHRANPNQVCMTGQLLWNDDVAECFPIEYTLRGFLVSTVKDSEVMGRMMELLMDYGSTDLAQSTSLMRILRDNVSLQMVCKQAENKWYPWFNFWTNRILPNIYYVIKLLITAENNLSRWKWKVEN